MQFPYSKIYQYGDFTSLFLLSLLSPPLPDTFGRRNHVCLAVESHSLSFVLNFRAKFLAQAFGVSGETSIMSDSHSQAIGIMPW